MLVLTHFESASFILVPFDCKIKSANPLTINKNYHIVIKMHRAGQGCFELLALIGRTSNLSDIVIKSTFWFNTNINQWSSAVVPNLFISMDQ